MIKSSAKIFRVPLELWKDHYYAVGAPKLRVLKERIQRGTLPGVYEAEEWIVYCDKYYNPQTPEWQREQPKSTGNKIADAILKKVAN